MFTACIMYLFTLGAYIIPWAYVVFLIIKAHA